MRVRTSSRAWLSLTPEPERELPAAIAVLRRATGGECAGTGAVAGRPADVAREAERAEALVLRGSEPSYLAWLREAAELAAGPQDRDGRRQLALRLGSECQPRP